MSSLDALVREASALGGADAPACAATLADDRAEVARVLQICNACRYCEGFCAVFPAMTRRLEFSNSDIDYLANLCHQCGACLHACQYAPPHDFGVNVPRAMARVRVRSYEEYAWPAGLGRLYRRNGLAMAIALTVSLALFLILALGSTGDLSRLEPTSTAFYAVFTHDELVSMFLPAFGFAIFALGVGVRRFWRGTGENAPTLPATAEAARNALTLKYLDGGHGEGCNEANDKFTLLRRRFHHLTFYGFTLCFLATSVATLYQYALHLPAPYGFLSLPKLLGVPGGIALLFGSAGLLLLQFRRHPLARALEQRPMDLGFVSLLFLVAASGLALAVSHGTSAMTYVLCVHLGAVMSLFLTMPYGKFAHAPYRCAALLKWSVERRRPNDLKLADD